MLSRKIANFRLPFEAQKRRLPQLSDVVQHRGRANCPEWLNDQTFPPSPKFWIKLFDLDQTHVETGGLTAQHVRPTRCWSKMFGRLAEVYKRLIPFFLSIFSTSFKSQHLFLELRFAGINISKPIPVQVPVMPKDVWFGHRSIVHSARKHYSPYIGLCFSLIFTVHGCLRKKPPRLLGIYKRLKLLKTVGSMFIPSVHATFRRKRKNNFGIIRKIRKSVYCSESTRAFYQYCHGLYSVDKRDIYARTTSFICT